MERKRSNKIISNTSFYNRFIEKPKTKHLSKIEFLHELLFSDELIVVELSKVFKRYIRSYKIEIIDSKDPLAQFSSSTDLFKDLLKKIKG